MQRNVLLLKDDVGKPKPSTHALPVGNHTYGRPELRDKEDAAAVSMNWRYHKMPGKQMNEIDYVL